jgi:hypothetical protein
MTSVAEDFANGDVWGFLSDVFGTSMPMTFFIGAVASLILMAIYINSRSVVLTAITAMLSGGVIVEWFPGEVRVAGFLLIFTGVAAVGSSIYLGRNRPVY